ncbi:DsbA family protein [Georgenia sp. AZ-5]|uniref:DsbA family protein n=1 Tax=Georgenia sp. AZ-5 TaxID=3367526 RepID=UPI003754D097
MTTSNMTKAERREAAREQARQLREAQLRREKRNRRLIVVGVVVLIAVMAAALFAIVRQGSESALKSVEEVPANTTLDGGISLGSSLTAGTANEGAPVIDVYLDFTCSYCGQFEEINADDIDEMVAAGDATVVYHPVAILDRTGDFSGFSGRAAQAAAVVADKAPEAYNDLQAALFDLYRGAGATEGATAAEPTDADIAAAALEAGVPREVADTIDDGTFTDWVAATTEQFGRDGFTGTPTVLVDGEEFVGWQEEGALAEAVAGA